MTAHHFPEKRSTMNTHDGSDPKMEQIRELLLGEYIQKSQADYQHLEARIRALEQKVDQRLDALRARVEALAGEVSADNRTSFDELAKNIEDLSRRIRQIPRD